MSKEKEIKDILVKFCKTEQFGACDIETWIEMNGIKFKPRDSDKDIEDRVDFFIKYVLNQNKDE